MNHSRRKLPFALLTAGILTFSACESAVDVEEEEHAEPEGVQLIVNGSVAASYDGDTQSWTGGITVHVGESTELIEVRFVDHDGDEIHLEEEFGLGVEIADDAVLSWELDTSAEFGGRFHGVSVGSTEVTIQLLHGGHPDYIAAPVTMQVSEP